MEFSFYKKRIICSLMAVLVFIALLWLSLAVVIGNCGSHFSGFLFCRAKVLSSRASVVTARGFGNCVSPTLEYLGSFVVAHWLSCSEACGIFPDHRLNLCPLHWQADSYPLHHQGSPHGIFTCFFVFWVSLVAKMVKNLSVMHETGVHSLGQEDPREKGMATHSSILAWEIPWTEEPGGLQSMGSQRVGHD